MQWRSCLILLSFGLSLMFSFTATATLTISEAIESASEHDSELRQAELSLRLAELELDATLMTFRLPSLTLQIKPPSLTMEGLSGNLRGSLSGSMSLPLGSSAQVAGSLEITRNSEDASWGLDGWSLKYTQKLDLSEPSGALSEIERRKEAVVNSQTTLDRTRNAVILNTIESYSQLLSDASAVDRAEQQLMQAEGSLRSIESLVDEGIKGASSLAQARLDALEAEIKLDRLKTSYSRDLDEFAREILGASEPIKLAPLGLPLRALRGEAEDLLERDELLAAAVETSTSVLSAIRNMEDAKEALLSTLREVLPDLSFEAGYTNDAWTIGATITFDFFAPDRRDRIEIARTNLALAQEKLAEAQSQQLNSLLNHQATLVDALHDLDRLALEEEKWDLEEQVMTSKYEAGTIGEADWKEFVESKDAFTFEARERETALLLAYLSYRDALGLELGWEEWLR